MKTKRVLVWLGVVFELTGEVLGAGVSLVHSRIHSYVCLLSNLQGDSCLDLPGGSHLSLSLRSY